MSKNPSNKSCCVNNCPNNKAREKLEGTSYFRIPMITNKRFTITNDRRKRRRDAWCAFLNTQPDMLYSKLKDPRICSKHFHSGKPAPEVKEDDVDWTPTLNPPAKHFITIVPNQILQIPKNAGARKTLTSLTPKRNTSSLNALSSRKQEPLPPNMIVNSNSVTDEDYNHVVEPTTFIACAVSADDKNIRIKEELMGSLAEDVCDSSSHFNL